MEKRQTGIQENMRINSTTTTIMYTMHCRLSLTKTREEDSEFKIQTMSKIHSRFQS